MGSTMLHQAAMDAVGGAGGAAANVGGVYVEGVQRLAATALSTGLIQSLAQAGLPVLPA